MDRLVIFATPWWVNLTVLIPIISYLVWKRKGISISKSQLITAAFFAIGFGFVEAAVVVYLRAAVGILPGYEGTLSDVARLSSDFYQQSQALKELPQSLFAVEFAREAATMIILISVAILTVRGKAERWAIFLWTLAIWDIIYYVGLWATVRWPTSLVSPDVLFLIPEPWYSQVWFPIAVSSFTILTVILTIKPNKKSEN